MIKVYCHKSILVSVSDFFKHKVTATEAFQNHQGKPNPLDLCCCCPHGLEFDYTEYCKKTVENYVDAVYDILQMSKLSLVEHLELVKFLKWEGKNMISGTVSKSSISVITEVLQSNRQKTLKKICATS